MDALGLTWLTFALAAPVVAGVALAGHAPTELRPFLLPSVLWVPLAAGAASGVASWLYYVAMAVGPAGPVSAIAGALAWSTLAVLVMFLSGAAMTGMKYIHVAAPAMPNAFCLAFFFLAGALAVAVPIAARRRRVRVDVFLPGLCSAVILIAQLYAMVAALRTLDAPLVFLSVFGGGPVLVVIISTSVLGERYPPVVWAATVAGIAGICLMLF